jgi:hypothetical protein
MALRYRTLLATALFASALAAIASAAAPSFEGKFVLKGKSYDLKYAWMVRGTSKLSPGEVKTYVIVSADDVSAKIKQCADVTCAVWDAVSNGIVLEPDKAGWWILVHDPGGKTSQHSGPNMRGSGWTETASTKDRLAGRLLWKPDNGDPIFDFKVDALLLKSWEDAGKK